MKHYHLLVFTLLLSAFCSCKGAEEKPNVPTTPPAVTDGLAVLPTTVPLPTGQPDTVTPSTAPVTPTVPATPTPVPVNTDSTTYTYIVNREFRLTEDFVPEGLTTPDILFPFSDTTIDKAKMTPVAGAALAKLFDAAFEEAHLVLYGVSGYRSYTRQYTIYATNLARYGIAHSNRYSAAPGASEHQTGLVMDISCRSEGFELEETFADTPEGKWVAANAHRFGFILRFPKGKEDITGYDYEPWHLRYVGEELAAYLYENDLTLEEYYNVPSTLTREYLDQTPFIDTTTERYLSIYRQYH